MALQKSDGAFACTLVLHTNRGITEYSIENASECPEYKLSLLLYDELRFSAAS
eukprot:SAG31_NODE_3996_length_3679_cov_1.092179_2_plen_53_part_00